MPEYFQFYQNNKMGIKTLEDQVVVEPKYDFVSPFSDGGFMVQQGDRFGFVDEAGYEFIPLTDQVQAYCDFSEGLAGFRKNDKYGYIDKTGKIIVSPRFVFAEPFHEGLAVVRDEKDHHGYVDVTGQMVIPFQFSFAGEFKGGYAHFGDLNTFGLIDRQGKVVVEPRYVFVGEVEDGRVTVQLEENGKYKEGVLTLGGEVEWNDRLEALNRFNETMTNLGREFTGLIDEYFRLGCPCRFPRFRDLVQWEQEDKCHDAELLFAQFKPQLDQTTAVSDPNIGGEVTNYVCPRCGTGYQETWQEYNIQFSVTRVKVVPSRRQPDLGAPTQRPMPVVLGFSGIEGYFRPERYEPDYLLTDIPALIAYLRARSLAL